MDINVAPGSYLVKPESPVFVRSGGQRAGKGRGQVSTDRLAEPPCIYGDRFAMYVDKILKRANLKTAKEIGVAIPSRYWRERTGFGKE
jgi:hypothetical protein